MKIKCCILLFLIALSTEISAGTPKKLFILLGQSNMAGRASIEQKDTVPLPMVQILDDQGCFENAQNPLNRYSNIRKKISLQKLGPGYTFAQKVSEELQDTIFIIVNARGGTPVERFMKNDSSGYYEKTILRIKQAMKKYPDLKPEAIIWHQGESNENDYESYISHLKTLVEDYRKDLNAPQLPFIAGEIGRWNPRMAHISKKIAMIPDSIPYTYLVSSQRLKHIDEFHFDSKSQRKLGKRFAKKYLETINKNYGK